MAKVDRLLATLRGEPPPDEPPPQEAAAAAPAPSSEAVSALEARLAELEGRLSQLAAPPPIEAPAADFPSEEVPPALPAAPAPEPPKPPTELTLFLHTKVELLERKLELAQQEALRANLLMREREEAQRKAQTEVEDLFRSIREAQRAANYDKTLREHYSSASQRVKELEGRLAAAQLKMVPADEVMRFVETEEGRAELKRRIEAQLGQAAAPEPPAPPAPPQPSAPQRPDEFLAPPLSAPGTGFALEQLSVVLARVSDLERRLEEAQAERDREREARRKWEQGTLEAMSLSRSRFERSGGPDMLVEAALEAVVECVRQRDALQLEMSRTVEALKDEPTGSEAAVQMRGKLALAHKRMTELQADLDKQLALVQAWVKRQTEGS